ncbi:uncharacterized protein LOC122645431 [Telopea speciosissima]|uniref:uncharacterized protein LOC122645431 n=1 Tax=Telopea speciosissima TaxID=54955 RepID=UPI001CC77F17|nr:uncharacterized protein LOC122645431 [Telopea speciosissima]
MAPYEALYGKKCRTPLYWDEVGERRMLGPELIQATCEKVDMIREKIKIAQSRQQSHTDVRRKDLEFQTGEKVFLCVSLTKGIMQFSKKGKLSPRYIGPYEILKRIGAVAYQLALPPSLEGVHNVFHISMLKKYVPNPTHILTAEPIQLETDMSYKEQPEEILWRKEHKLHNRTVAYVKVRWRNHVLEEASWEREEEMRERYPHLFGLQGRCDGSGEDYFEAAADGYSDHAGLDSEGCDPSDMDDHGVPGE